MNRLSQRLDHLNERVKGIEGNLARTNEKLTRQDNVINQLKTDMTHLTSNIQKEVFNELELRNSKANNIIISGLEELSLGTVSERHDHDAAEVKTMLTKIVADVKDHDIKKCFRIGHQVHGKARLLRVTFSNQELRNNILRNSRKLNNSVAYRKVYVNPDRTQSQRFEFKCLQSELLERKKRGEDVVIHSKRVIPRDNINSKNFH